MFARSVFRQLAPLAGRRALSSFAAAAAAKPSSARMRVVAAASAVAVAGATLTTAQCGWWPFGGQTSEWDQVRKELEPLLADGHGPLLVRLAWHSAGTWDARRKNGGSNGATMRFSPEANYGANNGLGLARDMIEEIKKKHPTLSYADLYTFAGKAAVEAMGGNVVPWKAGRTDAASGDACTEDGRLPDAAQGANHIRDIFYRMGFNDREIVALIGAHTLGECHKDRSGFVGPWTRDPLGMDNTFFTLLVDEKWRLSSKHSDPPQFEDSTGELMMLPADMALLVDPSFRKYVDLYAKDADAWQKDFAAAFGKLLELGVKR